MAGGADWSVQFKHRRRWVLLDARFQMLSVGNALKPGTSPRNGLDKAAGNMLLPRMHAALLDGRERRTSSRYAGYPWQTRVIPIKGPVKKAPLAVLGCYGPPDEPFPSVPLVGAWEWRVTPPGPDQQMRTYWSSGLYDVYGIPRPGSEDPDAPDRDWWEGPQWLDELILDTDRAAMMEVLDAFNNAVTDELFIHSFRVSPPGANAVHTLRLAGRSYVTDRGPGKWFRGVSARIHPTSEACDKPPGQQGFIEAVFAGSPVPMCVVNADYQHMQFTTRNFGELGIELPPHRHLPRMCHPDDLQLLKNFLKEAAEQRARTAGPAAVRLAAVGGGHRAVSLTGRGVRLSTTEPHHVLCWVTPVD